MLMRTIINYRELEERFGKFSFSDLRIIRELRFFQREDTHDITMVLDTERRAPNYRISVRFRRVSSLKIESLGGGSVQGITGFDVFCIADRQWDGLDWEVTDYENSAIHFYCESVEITSVSLLPEARSPADDAGSRPPPSGHDLGPLPGPGKPPRDC
jgi:hypothetical protein